MEQRTPGRHGSGPVGLGFLAVLCGAAGTHALTPIFPELEAALGIGSSQVRWLTAGHALAYALAGPLFGALSDRAGRRPVCLASLAVLSAGSFALALDPQRLGFPLFLGLRLLTGLAVGGLVASLVAWIADAVPYERRGRALTVVLSGSLVAVVLGMPLSALLAEVHTTAVFALLGAAAAWALLGLWRESPPPGRRTASRRRGALGSRAACALAVTLLNTTAAFLVLAAYWLTGRFDPRRLVGWALGASLLLSPWLPWPGDAAMNAKNVAALAALQALRMGPWSALLSELVEPDRRGGLLGLNGAASGVGIGLGTALSGPLYERFALAGPIAASCGALLASLGLFAYATSPAAQSGAAAAGAGRESA